jgi:hypothetical protein
MSETNFISTYSELCKLLKYSGNPIESLPTLDLGDRQGKTDYIDFLIPDEMKSPIMKFTDKFQRIGVAFLIKGISNEKLDIGGEKETEVKDLISVLAFFERMPNKETLVHSWGKKGDKIRKVYAEIHQKDHIGSLIELCPKCPFSNGPINENLLLGLLHGKDEHFRLGFE